MKTKDYISTLHLDSPLFDRDALLKALGKEMEKKLQARQNSEHGLDYRMFQMYIAEMDAKFSAIAAKTGGNLTKKLWGAFYASQIIPLRAKYCPKDHEEILKRREKYLQAQAEKMGQPSPAETEDPEVWD